MNKKVESKKVVVNFTSDESMKEIITMVEKATGNKFATETCTDGKRIYQIDKDGKTRCNVGMFQTECYVRPRSIELWVGYGALKRDTKETPIKSNTVKRALKCVSMDAFKTLCDKVATEKKATEKATEKPKKAPATEKTSKRKPTTEKTVKTENKAVGK